MKVGLRRLVTIAFRTASHLLRVGREFLDEEVEEDGGRTRVERCIRGERFASQTGAGYLAALGYQGMTQRDGAPGTAALGA